MKQIQNGTIEVNGTQCVLIDERAREGIFVDPKDLGAISLEPIDYGWKYEARFKHPDRMILQPQYQDAITDTWRDIEAHQNIENFKGCDTRLVFILKDQEQEAKSNLPFPTCSPELGKSYNKQIDDLNKIKSICERKIAEADQIQQVTKGEESPIDKSLRLIDEYLSETSEEDVQVLIKRISDKYHATHNIREGKTLEECKDEVAKRKYGGKWSKWDNLPVDAMFSSFDEVAELYRASNQKQCARVGKG